MDRDLHGFLGEAVVIRHAMALARVGGSRAVRPERVARRCGATLTDLPVDLRDPRELLRRTSLGCCATLAARISERVDGESDGEEMLRGIGDAYILFASEEPGWFETAMFSPTTMRDARSVSARSPGGRTPFEYLEHAFEVLVREGRVLPESVAGGSITCWAGVHGYATLINRGPLRSTDASVVLRLAREAVDRLVESALYSRSMAADGRTSLRISRGARREGHV